MSGEDELKNFVNAQDPVYPAVIAELKAGRKTTHWMWFIFPQLAGLGSSTMAQKFALSSLENARDYLRHSVLGPRLRECTQLLLAVEDRPIGRILGSPDDMKFRSSMTLFAAAAPEETIFRAALVKYYGGIEDSRTVDLLQQRDLK